MPDGSRDSTFHGTGQFAALPLAIQPVGGMVVHNNRIYLAYQGSGFPADRIWVYCFDMNGELDLQYGTNGRAQFQHTTIIEPKDLAAAPDGGILVAGSVGGAGARRRMVLRFDPTGQVDPDYGNNGIVILDSPGEQRFFNVAVLPDGRSLLTGFSTDSWSYYEAYAFVSLGPVGGRVFPMGAVGDTLGATVAPWPGTFVGGLVGYDSLERIMVVGGAPSQLVAGHGAIGFARYLNSDSYSIMGEQEAQRVNNDAVFPNPAQVGSEVFVRTSLRGPLQARIIALTGEVISAVPLRSQSGALLAVTVPPELPAGPYLLEVTGQSHRASSILLVQ
ncbi:MAG: hypothetical protein IPG92_17920 [Flavobacteriales bacterium]|nr:hypothetical protein [Flavobacteriales bacterium]